MSESWKHRGSDEWLAQVRDLEGLLEIANEGNVSHVATIKGLESKLTTALGLLHSVVAAKQKPGISNGEDSGSFNVILHGNWFIAASDFLGART